MACEVIHEVFLGSSRVAVSSAHKAFNIVCRAHIYFIMKCKDAVHFE